MKKLCFSLSLSEVCRGCVSAQQVLPRHRARCFLGLGFVQGNPLAAARAGHGWGMQAEEPCQGSLPWNIQPQCLLEANSQPCCSVGRAWPGFVWSRWRGWSSWCSHCLRGVGHGDTEPGVSSVTAPPLPSLGVLGCFHGRKSLWRFRK